MNTKSILFYTALLLNGSIAFAADSDTTGNSTGSNATTNNSTGDDTNSNLSTDSNSTEATQPGTTGGSSTDSNPGSTDSLKTPSNDSQASPTSSPPNSSPTSDTSNVNSTTTNTGVDVDVDANVTEVNNKVVIQGVTTAPTFASVELRNDVYYIPETVTPVGGFYFLNISSTERVCSLKKVTKVKVLSTPITTTVMIGKKKTVLYCYDKTYFNF